MRLQRRGVLRIRVVVPQRERRIGQPDRQDLQRDVDRPDGPPGGRDGHRPAILTRLRVARHLDGAPEVLRGMPAHVPLPPQPHQDPPPGAVETLHRRDHHVRLRNRPRLSCQLARRDEHVLQTPLRPQEKAERLVLARRGEDLRLARSARPRSLDQHLARPAIDGRLPVGRRDRHLPRPYVHHRPIHQRLLLRRGILAVVRDKQLHLPLGRGRRRRGGQPQHDADALSGSPPTDSALRLHFSPPSTGTMATSSSQTVPSPMW